MEATPPSRFSWPMRIFLSLLIFDICFRSMMVLVPCAEWREQLDVSAFPQPLPTPLQVQTLAEAGQLQERTWQSADSVWDYLKPWPSQATRARISSWADAGRFAVCWLDTRFEFAENVLGINQSWPMFSPDVSQGKTLARCQMLYEDGSRSTLRLTADPPDLTRYSHWFQEKVLDHELRLVNDKTAAFGHCNMLMHRHSTNSAGSRLKAIYLYAVHYRYAPPDVDAAEFLRAQNGPHLDQMDLPFYRYDVATRKGHYLDDWSGAWFVLAGLPFPQIPVPAAVGLLFHGDTPKLLHHLDS